MLSNLNAVPDGVPNGVFSIYLFRPTVLTARRLFRTDKALPQGKRYIKNPLCRLRRHLPKGEARTHAVSLTANLTQGSRGKRSGTMGAFAEWSTMEQAAANFKMNL